MKRQLDENVVQVADHYNSRGNQNRQQRAESTIFRLRGFNNWVKSVLISQYARPGMRVLDLAGGKGGDLAKWRVAEVGHLLVADVAHVAVQLARERYVTSRDNLPSQFPALFVAADCFGTPFLDRMDPAIGFDLVSCQFAFHYAFATEERLRTALSNITKRLEPGGFFLGTTPNALRLVRLIRSVPGHSWSNTICRLEFDPDIDKDCFPEFGARYTFTLADAVDSVPEYLVHPRVFARVAGEYGLDLVLYKEFPEWKETFGNDPRYDTLMKIMRVDHLSVDEWQAANLYSVFCFQKKKEKNDDGTDNAPAAAQTPKERIKYNHTYDDVISIT